MLQQGGVKIYPNPNLQHKIVNTKVPSIVISCSPRLGINFGMVYHDLGQTKRKTLLKIKIFEFQNNKISNFCYWLYFLTSLYQILDFLIDLLVESKPLIIIFKLCPSFTKTGWRWWHFLSEFSECFKNSDRSSVVEKEPDK